TIASSETKLLKTERKAVSEVRNVDYVGVGDSSLLRYLSPLIVLGRLPTTNQAQYLGTYLVQQAKCYVDGCGGSTQAMTLQRDGFAIISLDASQVEDRLLKLEHV